MYKKFITFIPALFLHLIPVLSCFAFCLWLQTHTFINNNILWLLNVGAKLLAGGKYYEQFVEVNAPMSVYIYLPAIWLSQLAKLNIIPAALIYFFTLAGLSWIFCARLLARILAKSSRATLYALEFALAISFFIMPAINFAEREYFLIILILPYLLLAIGHLQCQRVENRTSLLAGIMAGIGFSIKPYFIVLWSGIEIYLLLKIRQLKILRRYETLSCIIVFIIYAMSILMFTPSYITKVLPLVAPYYYSAMQSTLKVLILTPGVLFALILFLLALLVKKYSVYQYLIDLFSIVLAGTLCIYLMQRTDWGYHMLPIFMLGNLLLMLFIIEFVPRYNLIAVKLINKHFYKTAIFTLAITFATIVLFIFITNSIQTSLLYTRLYFEQPVFKLLKTVSGKPIYFLTSDQTISSVLTAYSKTYTPSHFNSLWLITAADKQRNAAKSLKQQQSFEYLEAVVRTMEIESLVKAKPVYFFVQNYEKQFDPTNNIFWLQSSAFKEKPIITYLDFFLQDGTFVTFWQNYVYQGQAGNFIVYKCKSC